MYDLLSIQPVIDLKISIPMFGFTMLICYAVSELIRMQKERLVEARYDLFKDNVNLFVNSVLLLNIRSGKIDISSAHHVGCIINSFKWNRND